VDSTLAWKIAGAHDIGGQLRAILNDKSYVMRTDRDGVCLLYWSLIVDLHSGILILLHAETHSPAFALVRPLVEAFLRLHVTIHGTENQLAAIKNGTYQTDFVAVGRQIDAAYGVEPLFGPFLENSKSALHGFTHGGLEQLLRLRAEGDIRPNFSDSEVLEVVSITTLLTYLTVLAVTEFLGRTAEYDNAARMFEQYRKYYRESKQGSAQV
jgi:hypothetical protein